MSFYTSLTGLNAATAQLGVTSNNIANVSTTGFKRSRTDFGDIFATSPLQKASATIGQGVSLKRVVQEFGQGNMVFSSNTLDLAISGDGFFPLKSQDGFQDIFTRNGVFMMNDQYNVVNSAGQKLMAASVDSSGKANLDDMNVLTIPQKTTGMAKQTSKVQLGLNFPADASVITKEFNRNDPESYNKSTALTVYDAGGNSYLASVYYVKTQNASQGSPNNKWQTYVYVGEKLVSASLQQATNTVGDVMYVNKYGELRAKSDFKTPEEIAELNSSFSKKTVKFSLDDLTDIRTSQPASISAGLATDLGTGSNDGINFDNYREISKSDLLRQQGSSAAVFKDFVASPTGNTIVTVAGLTDPITIPPNGSQGASIDQIASALNKDAGFANMYVAQSAHTVSTITGIQFANDGNGDPDVSFSSAEIVVGGQTITVKPLGSKAIDELAVEIQNGLNTLDVENNLDKEVDPPEGKFVVEVVDDALVITDTMNRNIESVKITPASNYAKEANGGTANFSGHVLRITAIDPNKLGSVITGTDTTPNLTIKQGTSDAITGEPLETHYNRAFADYTFNDAAKGYRAFFNNKPFEAATTSDLADLLNKDSTFASRFIAEGSTTSTLTIKSRDPSMADSAKIVEAVVISQSLDGVTGPFTQLTVDDIEPINGEPSIKASELKSIDDLKDLFTINVDNSIDPVVVGLDHLLESMKSLPSTGKKLSGTQIAAELTSVLNRKYGDEKPFDFTSVGKPTFTLELVDKNKQSIGKLDIDLTPFNDMRYEDLVNEVQSQINANNSYSDKVIVSYDTQAQKLVFSPTDNAKVTVSTLNTTALNLSEPLVQGVNDQSVGFVITPSVSTSTIRSSNDQRFGMKVEYDAVKQGFVFKSGTTGDASSIVISNIRPGSLATQTSKGLGMTGDAANYSVSPSTVEALRGITSSPAVLTGNAVAVNVDNNFSVDATNNQFVVSVNGITGTVVVPPKDTYTLGTFMEALQNGINNLQGPSKSGLTPETVNGVKVSFDAKKNALVFTSGTASNDSYIKVTGDAKWGLDGLDAKFGTTTSWIKPRPFKDEKGATMYIDGFGAETSSAAGFESLPAWSPIYFDKGELTFDTAGNLVSPKQGAQLDTVYLPNGKGALTINIDYSKSTQFASPFAVLSQSQDGAPEGDLVGLAIKDDGLVAASYSNGAQKSLAKVVLVNFSNPTGLRQIGDTNYYKTSESGTPKYGEAGSAGFGTVRSGATERANVDLTQELVDLITEQRNFQANAKAMETSTSMTQTIIQIRN